jgi:hypothetical protein
VEKRAIRQKKETEMNNLTDIEFDHNAPSVKQRVLNGSVTHTQNGVVFSAGYEPLRRVKVPVAPSILQKKKKAAKRPQRQVSARERAAEKLEGFKDGDAPDAVKDALREDASAKHAEELAE